MRQVGGLPNNSYKPITNTACRFAPGFVNYKKGCTRLAATSEKVYQLLSHGRWFSPCTPASSNTKTSRHDIAEILLKVALNNKAQSINLLCQLWIIVVCIPYIENLLITAECKYLPHNQDRVAQTLLSPRQRSCEGIQ